MATRVPSRPARAFTLIELMVVISIILLLIAMLLPTLAAARESARQMVCGSNMRQFGLAYSMYANDHDNWINPAWMPGPQFWDGLVTGRPWHERFSRIGSYSPNDYGLIFIDGDYQASHSYLCPSEDRASYADPSPPYPQYGANQQVAGTQAGATKDLMSWRRFSDLTSSGSRVVLMTDNVRPYTPWAGFRDQTAYRHGTSSPRYFNDIYTLTFDGASLFLYADGHAVARKGHDVTNQDYFRGVGGR